MKRLALIAVLALAGQVVLPVSSPVAWAQGSATARIKKRLARGNKLFADLDYRKCIRVLAPVPKDPAASRAQRLRALELIGLSYLILGEKVRAKDAFEDLLAIDPGYQLRDDTGSPKIRDFFAKVKRAYVPGFDAGAVAELEHAAPEGATAGRRVEIEVRVGRGADKVKSLVLLARRRGVLAYKEAVGLRQVAPGRWRARFKAPNSNESYVLEYYLEARGVTGSPIGRAGGPETPLSLQVSGRVPRATPWWRRWYVIAGGAAVVGGIGTALIVTSGGGTGDGTLPPGRITLTP